MHWPQLTPIAAVSSHFSAALAAGGGRVIAPDRGLNGDTALIPRRLPPHIAAIAVKCSLAG